VISALEDTLRPLRGVERVTARCAHCTFVVRASVTEAHAAFEAHVCDRPKPTLSKRRRSGFALH
jgi:hypothetical protein